MEDFEKFKHLLEYFVAHLEYVVNEDEGMLGYDTYIKPLVEKSTFKKQGQGYNGQSIQNQIEKWESYSNGYDILINIYAASASPYQNKACYLNWEDTWVNVRPNWKNGHIIELYLTKEEKSDANSEETRTIKELGLFDNTSPNDVLKEFFNKYKKLLDNYISKQNEKNMNEQIQKYVNLLKSNHNLILTGAPGTGKTYLTKQIAEAMGCTENEIGFVQFHPSYDYTDFVEGLRPLNDTNGNVGFERKDGVFKEFCKKALLRSDSNDTSLFNGINDNPKVWKVSLSGTGDNEIRTYCKENNCIRIGWEEYGNVEDFSEYDFKESEVAKNFRSKGLAVGEKILKSFQNEMVIGDIVVSCYSEKETDAIGIITGDYEYIEDLANNYPRCRKVRWIWKGEPIDIMELNNKKKLTLSTIYKLDIDPISIKDFITKKGGYIESKKENRKYIFIIDEINRGEISKIFGELFFSIDPGYRGKKGKVQTQYQNMIEEGDVFKDGFYVPENVYIIGTMNDIDRSVESMDFAFRRRFAFVEVKASENTGMLEDKTWKDEAIKRMNSLNAEIEKIEGLSSAYHIGASYFLKLDNYNNEFEKLWEYHLEGLLREYLRGMQNVDELIVKLKNAYDLKAGVDDSNSNN